MYPMMEESEMEYSSDDDMHQLFRPTWSHAKHFIPRVADVLIAEGTLKQQIQTKQSRQRLRAIVKLPPLTCTQKLEIAMIKCALDHYSHMKVKQVQQRASRQVNRLIRNSTLLRNLRQMKQAPTDPRLQFPLDILN